MEVTVAKNAGFCFGVRRAIRMVEKALDGSRPVWAFGPVIHNPQAVAALHAKGLRTVGSLDEVGAGTVIVRSHGAPPSLYRELEARGLPVVDTTCPFVKKMHREARELHRGGYQVIIVGDRDHSEITSLTEDPDFRALVVGSPVDLDGVRVSAKVGLVAQTTQSLETYRAVVDRLLSQAGELRVFTTICDATAGRQAEAVDLASKVDLMVVVGGRNSANTRRLVELCREARTRTIWVETAAELDPAEFAGVAHVGLTAGASTPDWIIHEVIDRLASLSVGTGASNASPPEGGHIPQRR